MAKTVLQRDTEGDPQQAFLVNDTIQNADGTVSAVASDAGLFLYADGGNVQISVLPDGSITLASTGNTTITLAADGTVQIEAGGLLTVAPGNTFDEVGNVSLAAGVVTIGTDGAVDIGPGNLELAADGTLDVASGALVVAGDASAFTVNAGAVSLNLPTVAGASGTLWADSGVVKVAP